MGRVRAGARPAVGCPGDAVPGRATLLLQRLLVALASLALLGAGAVELLPRAAASAALGATATASGPAAATQMSAPHGAALLRGAPLGTAPGPPGPGAGLPPGSGPVPSGHLPLVAVRGQTTSSPVGTALGAAEGRAPPAGAGT